MGVRCQVLGWDRLQFYVFRLYFFSPILTGGTLYYGDSKRTHE